MSNSISIEQPQVTQSNNRAVTTSIAVAEYFGKQHKNILQSIENLKTDCPAVFYGLNFQLCFRNNELANNKRIPYYELTRDGFVLLAMGFTGKRALQFKIAYIEAFNRMETQLTAKQLPAETLTPAQQRYIQKVVAAKTKDIVNRDRAFAHIYHHLKEHFHVAKYSQIPAERFEEPVNMIERMELSYLEKYTDARITEVESAALVYVIEKSAEMADAIRALSPLAVRAGQKLPMIAQQ